MKIAPLMLASATALETASTAHNLLAAVGHRNATKMEALVQGLVEESISEPGWKFDEDIKEALEAIRSMFVKNIQKALKDQHRVDQEFLNSHSKNCFGECNRAMCDSMTQCEKTKVKCEELNDVHVKCREDVKDKYTDMAKKCNELHMFDIPDPVCNPEDCLCPDLSYCHTKGGYDEQCTARLGECKGKFGNWMQGQITKYKSAHEEWSSLHKACKEAYHAFLTADATCDADQKSFEQCMCEQKLCEDTAVLVDFTNCQGGCWDKYVDHVKETECLEKDRKIDWSATKKIECYVDILLHDYNKEELIAKCGDENCINKAREEDYKHCHTICQQVDHDGEWPEVQDMDKTCDSTKVVVSGHKRRLHVSQYLLGDEEFKDDMNGVDFVFSKHRGGDANREGEQRCTEHLDIDYPVPPCVEPPPPPAPVCDAAFHKKYYFNFDDVSMYLSLGDWSNQYGATCFPNEKMSSSADGYSMSKLTIVEHSEAWAYNRCQCTDCTDGLPNYSPSGMKCGYGAHMMGSAGSAYKETVVAPPRVRTAATTDWTAR